MAEEDYSGLKQTKKQRDIPSQNSEVQTAQSTQSPWEKFIGEGSEENSGYEAHKQALKKRQYPSN